MFKKGHTTSVEIRKKISQSLLGNIPWNKGKTLSAEHKLAIGISSTGRNTGNQFAKGNLPNKTSFKKGSTAHERNKNWKCGISVGENKKEYNRFMCLIRHTRKIGSEGSHTLAEWAELKKKYNFMCLCCKKQEPNIKLTEDHIVPLSKGGSNDISNIQPLCKSCNSRKYTTCIDYRNTILTV